ncbi:hypothetical protein KYB31_05590 [Clostridium felsineum]|uniref:hypothetical protein n=1 Tax=Clostridium felsineum TaxID=36839 RepID=UPI00214D8797|nr:hypothetical protein [Clostridium felsineum]MCR3758468.1 hypothetical protein [Clostridium felsineum]
MKIKEITNCLECEETSSTCIHYEAYRRFPRSKGGLGLCPKLKDSKGVQEHDINIL